MRKFRSGLEPFLLVLFFSALGLPALELSANPATEDPPTALSEAERRRNLRIDRFLLDSMRAGDLDVWIVMTREGNFDPLSADLGFTLGRGALLFFDRGGERAERRAVVSALDLVPLRESGIYDEVTPVERETPFEKVLAQVLERALATAPFAEMAAPRIGVNMSESSGIADGLSATSLELLRRALGPDLARCLVSAETTVLSFRSKKLPQEIELYRRAAALTHEILHTALTDGFLVPGKTTQAELRDHVQELAARRGFPEVAWERESFPGVYSGLFSDLSHAEPGARVIAPGDILWIDFGIRYEGYTTDMIRAAYLLRPGETAPPAKIRHMFETLIRANRAAAAEMRPGVRGYEVDAAARRTVTEAGYPEYFHAAGHPVGVEVHDAGPSLGPRGPKYGSAVELPLEAGQIFAVEPSVMLPREGGALIINVEEEVLVTAKGGEYLTDPQTELYLIPSSL